MYQFSDISCKEVRVCCQENHKFEGSILTPIPSSTTHDMEIEIEVGDETHKFIYFDIVTGVFKPFAYFHVY